MVKAGESFVNANHLLDVFRKDFTEQLRIIVVDDGEVLLDIDIGQVHFSYMIESLIHITLRETHEVA